MSWRFEALGPGPIQPDSVTLVLTRDGATVRSWMKYAHPTMQLATACEIMKYALDATEAFKLDESGSFLAAIGDALRHLSGADDGRKAAKASRGPTSCPTAGPSPEKEMGGLAMGLYTELVVCHRENERFQVENAHLRDRVAMLEGVAFGRDARRAV
jgi:hypothetical protein